MLRKQKNILLVLLIAFISVQATFLVRTSQCEDGSLAIQNIQNRELTSFFWRITGYHLNMDGNVLKGSTIFIGDSIVQSLCVSAIASPAVNYGIGRDTTVGVLTRIPLYRSLVHAKAVVLLVGINDFFYRGPRAILANYKKILNSIPEGVPVVVHAILPVDETAKNFLEGMNVYITTTNKLLRELCESFDGRCSFVAVQKRLFDNKGNLRKEYCRKDGVHLNPMGNALLIDELRKGVEDATRFMPAAVTR